MASIATSIEVYDRATQPLNMIVSALQASVHAFAAMNSAMDAGMDTASIDNARQAIEEAVDQVNNLQSAIQNANNTPLSPAVQAEPVQSVPQEQVEPIELPVEPVVPQPIVPDPEPVTVPVNWESDNLDVFTNTGVERFEQELNSANQMMNTMVQNQQRIQQTASGMDILPDGATQDLQNMVQRIQQVQTRIQALNSTPVSLRTDEVNNELEQLRSQLAQAVDAQNELNSALDNMDAERANAAYLQLSRTVGNTERYIRDNTNEQGRFNQAIQQGVNQSNDLMNTIKGVITAYVSIQTVKKALDMSDELTMTTARLNMMNEAFNEINGTVMKTDDLVNLVYSAAQDARGSFGDMATVVAKFGNNARDAFSSQEEVVAFANLIQKQMTIAGASTAEASNAMLQLSQALGSGVLRGDELNSIFEQAPNLIQSIADYMDVPIGQIRAMAQEGQLSADIVKAAIFASADDINEKFGQMPRTWNQVWTAMTNTALMRFQPVLDKINQLANNAEFQQMLVGVMDALSVMTIMLLDIMEFAGQVAAFFQENWSVIEPIIMGIVTALGLYLAVSTAVNVINGIMAASEAIKGAAQMMATGATFAETAAQWGLNAALAACPITWIILAIIVLIALIIAVCQWIANTTGVANTAFGVIMGGIFTVGAFFKNVALNIANTAIAVFNWIKAGVTNIGIAFQNFGMLVANIALGIWAAIGAVCDNIGIAFHNVIANVTGWWYGLLSDILSVIAGIAEALNALPFVEFDYSGVANAAAEYAQKSAEAYDSTEDYQSLADAFAEGMSTYTLRDDFVDMGAAFDDGISTFDTFQDGWASDAFNAGAEWGDGVAGKVSDFFGGIDVGGAMSDMFGGGYDMAGYDGSQIPSNIADTAGNTAATTDALDITDEDLKYLRDIAERDVINRFTTAEIHVDMTNNNTVNSDVDLDGMIDYLASGVQEAMEVAAEGVHV